MEFKGPKGIIGVVFVIIAIALIFKQNIRRDEMKGWPSVDGRVVNAYISDHIDREVTTIQDVKIRKEVYEYTLHVSYEYSVDGIEYFGNNLGFKPGKKSKSLKSIERLLNQFPEGKKVEVYYDPGSPHDSILYP